MFFRRKLRCAIIEYENCHDQVIPIFVYALNKLGIIVHIYTTKHNKDNNVFVYDNKLEFEWKDIELGLDRGSEEYLEYHGYDIILFNTLNFGLSYDVSAKKSLEIVHPKHIPIGVMHHGEFIQQNQYVQSLLKNHNGHLIVLSENVAQFVRSIGWNCEWILPVYFGHVPQEKFSRKTFCVQGSIFPHKKNYKPLIEAIAFLKQYCDTDFRFIFVGRSDGDGADLFKEELHKKNIADVCEFTEGEVGYDEFLKLIACSDFLIMLTDSDQETGEVLYQYKLTSGLFYVFGLGVVPVVEKKMAEAYDVADCGVLYDEGELGPALMRSLTLTENEILKKKKLLEEKKERHLSHAVDVMRRIIKKFSAR